eukprot:jgi/Chlat1/1983/Chrsp158S02313
MAAALLATQAGCSASIVSPRLSPRRPRIALPRGSCPDAALKKVSPFRPVVSPPLAANRHIASRRRPTRCCIEGTNSPEQWLERNGHRVAFELQRAFYQACVEGLGKPRHDALKDFVLLCMETYANGVDYARLQLLLVQAQAALEGAYAVVKPVEDEADAQAQPVDPVGRDMKLKLSWIRLLYMTLDLEEYAELSFPDGKESLPLDPGDKDDTAMLTYVQKVRREADEDGLTVQRIGLEQLVAGPESPAMEVMRNTHYMVLQAMDLAREAKAR